MLKPEQSQAAGTGEKKAFTKSKADLQVGVQVRAVPGQHRATAQASEQDPADPCLLQPSFFLVFYKAISIDRASPGIWTQGKHNFICQLSSFI